MRMFWTAILLSFLASTGSTILVERYLDGRVALLGSFAGLQKSLNAGVAFGMDMGRVEPLLIAVALGAVIVIARKTARTRLSTVGFGLMAGGGLANIADRMDDGFVTDVFQVGSFPVFNVADICVTAGVAALLWEGILLRRSAEKGR